MPEGRPDTGDGAVLPAPAAAIAAGYAFVGPSVDLGALLWGDSAYPDAPVAIPLAVLDRHGLVAGATGTGRTRTLQIVAEQLSAQGVPVFLTDVKGDLSGIAKPGSGDDRVRQRAAEVGQRWSATGFPAEFYALGGLGGGIPVRATVTGFGPLLMSRALGLNQAQEQSLVLVYHYADTKGLELSDLKDLRAVTAFLGTDQGRAELADIGGIPPDAAGGLLRTLTDFEAQGGAPFFGEPGFDPAELLRGAGDGRGVVSVLELPAVQDRPQLSAAFLMWLLADLCQSLPDVGEPGSLPDVGEPGSLPDVGDSDFLPDVGDPGVLDRPRLVYFLDEAHLLFDGASQAFLEAVTRTVRLSRAKGVGIFFATGTPEEVPGDVLRQLGNRVQHAVRVSTPDDVKALRATVSAFPRAADGLDRGFEHNLDLGEALTGLDTGEAVVTVLGEDGAPTPVAATRLRAPESSMGPLEPADLDTAVRGSGRHERYAAAADRESAYEKLAAAGPAAEAVSRPPTTRRGAPDDEAALVERAAQSAVFTALARSPGTQVGPEITRTVFGVRARH